MFSCSNLLLENGGLFQLVVKCGVESVSDGYCSRVSVGVRCMVLGGFRHAKVLSGVFRQFFLK